MAHKYALIVLQTSIDRFQRALQQDSGTNLISEEQNITPSRVYLLNHMHNITLRGWTPTFYGELVSSVFGVDVTVPFFVTSNNFGQNRSMLSMFSMIQTISNQQRSTTVTNIPNFLILSMECKCTMFGWTSYCLISKLIDVDHRKLRRLNGIH